MAKLEDPRLGTVVQDRYRVLERIAAGGMGVVYRAERLQLGRTVALKFLHPAFAADPTFLGRFEHEAKLMSRLDHPHCVSVIDFGVADAPYIVMEYVTGPTLRDVLDDDEPLPPERAIRIARQILAGLAHAHEQGIVHRDIKPANLMLANATGTGDHARILDFGLAKLRGVDQSTASTVVGTPSYMSPEQTSMQPVDGRADIYATALVLYELLTGERAFYADEPFEVIRMHREEPAPPLSGARPGLRFSDELERAVATALAKRPADRHQSPTDFADALAATPEAGGAAPALSFSPAAAPPRGATPAPPLPPRAATPAPVLDATALDRADTALVARAPRRRRLVPGKGLVFTAAAGALAVAGWKLGWVDTAARAVNERRGEAAQLVERLTGSAAAAPVEPAAQPPASFDEVERLRAAGERERAIGLLHELRRLHPDDARAPYQLGALYVEKGWVSEALAAYAEALDRDPSYASRADLLGHTIDALADPATRNKARALILRRLESAAVPALERAGQGKGPRAAQARRLLAELEARAAAQR